MVQLVSVLPSYILLSDVDVVLRLETRIHREVKEFHYLPLIPFGGCYKECFNDGGLSIAEDLILQIKEKLFETI